MANKARIILALVIAVSALGPASARAVLLSDLFSGSTINALNLHFFDWGIEVNPDGVDPSKIEVTALVGDPYNPGILFTVNDNVLSVTAGDSIDFEFNFKVKDLGDNAVIKDNSLSFEAAAFTGTGSSDQAEAKIEEDVFETDGTNVGTNLGLKTVIVQSSFGVAGPDTFSDSLDFAPHSILFIEKRISLVSIGTTASASITSFTQNFSQVPEPGTLMLLGAGLAGLGLRRRRRGEAAA